MFTAILNDIAVVCRRTVNKYIQRFFFCHLCDMKWSYVIILQCKYSYMGGSQNVSCDEWMLASTNVNAQLVQLCQLYSSRNVISSHIWPTQFLGRCSTCDEMMETYTELISISVPPQVSGSTQTSSWRTFSIKIPSYMHTVWWWW